MPYSKLKYIIRDHYHCISYMASRFRDDLRGVAAIEFAFLAPLMAMLYVGTIEISSAVSANRKLSRASSTLGDLITQMECISDPTLNDIVHVVDDIMHPFQTPVGITIAGIEIKNGNAAVRWSRAYNATGAAVGSPYAVPNKIKKDGNFLVAVKTKMNYYPILGWLSTPSLGQLARDNAAISMEEEIFLRPRIGSEVVVQSGSCAGA